MFFMIVIVTFRTMVTLSNDELLDNLVSKATNKLEQANVKLPLMSKVELFEHCHQP